MEESIPASFRQGYECHQASRPFKALIAVLSYYCFPPLFLPILDIEMTVYGSTASPLY